MSGRLTDDPVRWATVVYAFIQAVIAVLLLAGVISETVGGIIVGITAAGAAAVSELVIRPATVPRAPLAELAEAEKRAGP